MVKRGLGFLRVAVQKPPDLPAALLLVVEGEARFLERLDVPADRAQGDVMLIGQVRGRDVTALLDPLEDLPLADDFGVPH